MSDDPTARDPYRGDPARNDPNYYGGRQNGNYPGFEQAATGDTAPIPTVPGEDADGGRRDSRDKAPSRIPTILVSLFLGPFGAITAAITAGEARRRGFPRATYWLSFIFSWAVHLLIITAVVVAWLLGAFDGIAKSSSTPSPTPSVTQSSAAPATTAAPAPVTTSSAPRSSSSTPTPTASSSSSSASNLADFPAGASKMCGTSVAANAATTCDFATAVMNAYMSSGSFGRAATVQAKSPVTGQEYTMNCNMDANAITTCTGGNGASVYMR